MRFGGMSRASRSIKFLVGILSISTTLITLSAPSANADSSTFNYSITYAAGDGSGAMAPQTGTDTSVSLIPSTFNPPAGKHFTGWLGNDSISYTDGQSLPLNADLTLGLTAQYAVNTYTYSINYGSGAGSGSMGVQSGSDTSVSLTPSNFTPPTGEHFTGWLGSDSLSYTDGQSVPLTSDLTLSLTAQYAADTPTFTVTFNSNGATSGTVLNPVSYQDGDTVTIDASNTGSLAHEGQTFFGWSGTNNGSSVFLGDPTLYGSGATTSFIIHSNVTLYAQFNVDSYLAYDANGGTGSRAPDVIVTNWPPNHLTLPDGTGFTKDGYTFGGWTKVKDDASTLVTTYGASDLTGASGDTYTVYALWTPIPVSYNYSITYAAGNGTGAMDTQGGSAPSIVLASNSFAAPSGEHFTGWLGDNSISYTDGQSIPLSSDLTLTLTAQYAANPPCYTAASGVLSDGTSCVGAVVIDSGVTSINQNAFAYDSALTSIVIPDSVIDLGLQAFTYDRALTSVTIGSGVTVIADNTFRRTQVLLRL